jgi:beta-phosphoglucomutase
MPPTATSQIQAPRAILFDYDGVLVASEPLHWAAWGALLRELGIAYRETELMKMAGMTAPMTMAALAAKYRPDWMPSEEELKLLAQRKNDFYMAKAVSDLKLYPGVLDGLGLLREKGIACAIVTNGRRRELHKTVEMLGIKDFFAAIISREDSGASKPDPTPYLYAAGVLGFAPEEGLAVEDSPTGLEAALMARVPAVAITTNFTEAELTQPVPGRPDLRPILVLPSMTELFSRLR